MDSFEIDKICFRLRNSEFVKHLRGALALADYEYTATKYFKMLRFLERSEFIDPLLTFDLEIFNKQQLGYLRPSHRYPYTINWTFNLIYCQLQTNMEINNKAAHSLSRYRKVTVIIQTFSPYIRWMLILISMHSHIGAAFTSDSYLNLTAISILECTSYLHIHHL